MNTAQHSRFESYVLRTTRPGSEALKKRLAMYALLDGHEIRSMRVLAERVGGNTKDAAWASDAVKAGEIVLVDGTLRLPDAVAARHETRSIHVVRKQLLDLIEAVRDLDIYDIPPDDENPHGLGQKVGNDRGNELLRDACYRLNTAAIMIGCEWELDPESDLYAQNRDTQKFWKARAKKDLAE